MKKKDNITYITPEAEILLLKMEGLLCVSAEGTEDVDQAWYEELT